MSLSDTNVGNTSFSSNCSRRSPQFMLRHGQGGQRQPPARTHSSPPSAVCARAAPLPLQAPELRAQRPPAPSPSTAQQGGYGPASAWEASSRSKSPTPRYAFATTAIRSPGQRWACREFPISPEFHSQFSLFPEKWNCLKAPSGRSLDHL